MIRFDGYYLEEPSQIHNGRFRDNRWTYIFNAFHFEKGGTLKICIKHDHIEYLNNFKKEDFDDVKAETTKYNISSNQLIIKTSSPFGNDSVLEILNENTLFHSHRKRKIHFIPWERIKDDKTNVLKDLLDSLDKSKLNTYYE